MAVSIKTDLPEGRFISLCRKTERLFCFRVKQQAVIPLFFLTLIALFFIFVMFCPAAEEKADPPKANQPSSLSTPLSTPLKFTSARRSVRVGYFLSAGFQMTDSNGNRSGYCYDYLQRLRGYSNFVYTYSDSRNRWSDVLPMLKSGQIDLVAGVAKTAAREKEFAFSKFPIGEFATILTVKEGNTRYRNGDYANWNGIRIGFTKGHLEGNEIERLAREKGFHFQTVPFESPNALFAALQEGSQIDAAVSSAIREFHNEWLYEEFDTIQLYIAVRKDDTALLNELNAAQQQLKTHLPGLEEQLQGQYGNRLKDGRVLLNEREQLFVEQARKSGRAFTCIINPDRRPLSWYEKGEMHGIFKDYADEISRRTGLNFRFLPVQTRAEYADKRNSPEVEIVFDTVTDFQYAERFHLVLSEPYLSASVSLLRDKKSANRLKTVAILEHSDFDSPIRSFLSRDVTVVPCDSMTSLLEQVKTPECDATFLHTRSAEYAVFTDKDGQLVSTYVPSLENTYSIGIKEGLDPLLLSILNKGVKSLDRAFTNKIDGRYTPQFKEIFSLRHFIHQYFLLAIVFPFAFLFLTCAGLVYTLSHRKKAYQTGVLFSRIPQICFVLGEDGHVLYCLSGGDCQGMPELTYRQLEDVKNEELRELVRAKLESVLKTGQPDMFEFPYGERYCSCTISRLPDSAFGVNTVLLMIQDISELCAVREAARKTEEYFRLVVHSVGDGIITTDAEGRVILLNPVAEKLIGLSGEEAEGRPHEEIFRIVSALDEQPVASPLKRALDEGISVELGNHTDLLAFNGQRFHIADCASPIRDEDGTVIGAVLIFRNVTEAYNRREELRQHIAIWTAVATVASLQTYRMEIKTRRVLGNQQMLDMLSNFWPIVDGIALSGKDWIVPEDLDEVMAIYRDFLDGKTESFMFDYRSIKEGKLRYFRQYGHLDPSNPNILIGLIQDITAIKEAEKERNAAQELWAQVVDAMPIMLFVKSVDDDFRCIQCSRNFSEFLGRTREEVVSSSNDDLFNRPRDVQAFYDIDRRVINEGQKIEFFEAVEGADGKVHQFRTVKTPYKDPNGKSLLIGMSVDITELVEQRENFRASNVLLETGSRLTRSCSFQMDSEFRIIQSNGMSLELWPQRNKQFLPVEEWIYPEDLQSVLAQREDLIKGIVPEISLFFRTDWYEERRWYRSFLRREYDSSGIAQIFGVVQDVTELVEKAELLEERAQMWRSVMDELPVLFFVKDISDDFRYLMFNRFSASFLGITADEVVGKTSQEIQTPNSVLSDYFKQVPGAVEEGTVHTRWSMLDVNGDIREIEKLEMTSCGRNGKKLLVGIGFDITEQEQNLRLAGISARILSKILVESDFNKVLDIIADSVIEVLNCRRVIFAKSGEDNRLHFRQEKGIAQSSRFVDGPVELCERFWNLYLDQLNRNETICFNRLGDFPELEELCQKAPAYSDLSFAAVPSISGDKLSGVLIVTNNRDHHFSQIDLKLLRTVCDCIQIAEQRDLQERTIQEAQREQARQLTERTVINNCLTVFMNSDYLKVPFDQILEIIRNHLGASCCYALRIDPETRLQTCLAEAVIPGRRRFLLDMAPMPFDPSVNWYQELKSNQVISWPDLSSEEAKSQLDDQWSPILLEQGFQSLWSAALSPAGEIWGCLEIGYDQQSVGQFSSKDESFVRSVARLVSLILMRNQSRDNLIQARDQLTVALEQAQSAERFKSYFLASMSHEIRTPLNAVIGFTELLQNNIMDPATVKDYLQDIYTAGNALLQLINDILDLSKLEADQMPIFPEPSDFRALGDEVLHMFIRDAQKKGLVLGLEVSKTLPVLDLDRMRIRQILFNVIGNAVKFTLSGSIILKGDFYPTDDLKGTFVFSVTDTGIGISSEDRKRLTEPFVQLSKLRGTNAANNGTGLGLAICKRMIEKMNGTIEIESQEGAGSTFRFTLFNIPYGKDLPEQLPVSEVLQIQKDLKDFIVLIVDDVQLNLKVLKALCVSAGVTAVRTASSGEEALEIMAQEKPGLVLTDLWMTGMSGSELAKIIRNEPRYNDVDVVAVTADIEAKENFSMEFFSAILLKPVTPEKLNKIFIELTEGNKKS